MKSSFFSAFPFQTNEVVLTNFMCMVGSPDVVQKLWKMELAIQKAQVNSSPEGKAISLFSVTDNRYVLTDTTTRNVGLLGRLLTNWL